MVEGIKRDSGELEKVFSMPVGFDIICREAGVSKVPAIRELMNAGFELRSPMKAIEPDEAIETFRRLEQMRAAGVIKVAKRPKA